MQFYIDMPRDKELNQSTIFKVDVNNKKVNFNQSIFIKIHSNGGRNNRYFERLK